MTKYILFLLFIFSAFTRLDAQTVPPSTCSIGEILVDSGGQSEYWCISTNHWLVRPISTLDYVHVNVPYGVAGLDMFGQLNPAVIPSSVINTATGRVVMVANLPAATTSNENTFWWVTDGNSATDCAVGGGSNIVGCRNNTGAYWTGVAVGGSGSGGGLTTAGSGLGQSGATVYLPNAFTGTPGTFNLANSSAVVDAFGRITGITANSANALTTAGSGLSQSGNTVSLPTQSGVAGAYTNANVTVDNFGRITAVSNGTSGTGGVSTLSGAVVGAASTTKLRDWPSALDSGSTTTGIESAVTGCGSTPCTVIVPGSYPTTETIPGQGINDFGNPNTVSASTIGSNVMIEDYRYGGEWRVQNNPLGNDYSNNQYANNWNVNYSQATTTNWTNLFGFNLVMNATDGGVNDNTGLFSSKMNYEGIVSELNSWTPGQHIGIGSGLRSYSVGDTLPFSFGAICYGGYTATSDEGCEGGDQEIFMGNVEVAGSITGSPTTGATSVTISPTQGGGTQGAERFILETTAGKTVSGTATAVSSSTGSPTVVTVGTTSSSQAAGTLNTNISGHGSSNVTVTPTFTQGTISNIHAGDTVCVGGAENFEQVTVTSVGASSFVASFAKSHSSSSLFGDGGGCGFNFEFTADQVTNSTYPTKIQTITGTLNRTYPVISSTSSTVTLWVNAAQALVMVGTSWKNTSGKNGYTMYQSAQIKSVTSGTGGVSNSLTLYPNNVAWASGDTFIIPVYPMNRLSGGNFLIENYQGNPTTAQATGLGVVFNGLTNSGLMLALSNNTPFSFYQPSGGNYYAPTAASITGETYYGFQFQYMPDHAGFYFGCSVTGCTNQYSWLMSLGDVGGYDLMYFDQVHGELAITSNGQAGSSYKFGSGTIMSGTSSNTDFVGSLTFSSSSSQTQSLTGRYTTHASCQVTPQFNPGTGVNYWVTYTGTSSFTVNFSSPVTGVVAYACLGQN